MKRRSSFETVDEDFAPERPRSGELLGYWLARIIVALFAGGLAYVAVIFGAIRRRHSFSGPHLLFWDMDLQQLHTVAAIIAAIVVVLVILFGIGRVSWRDMDRY